MKFLLAISVMVFLTSCAATGIQMTAEEAAACRAEGCSVWTENELRGLAERFFREGYGRGLKAGAERSQHTL